MPLDHIGAMPEWIPDAGTMRREPDVIADAVARATTLAAEARFDEAEPLLRSVISAYEQTIGSTSHEVAASCEQLASVLVARNELHEAVSCYQRALEIKRQLLDDSDPSIATTLHDLALLLEALGAPQDARLLWAEARSILETRPGL
jgi:tetratricopeptide (TPR) repeat protein